ncbi:hypothetical protein ZIOFF_002660 [Zingiber officinale]|uniref:Uncharacterized protein n=1 Tax=Zingiber officinale TaxID=94328 RepID=A0A8J5HWL7_ZINOF|nr:hypothetical protein ZIOFF_002660 [Zingiber officinale]
MYRWFQVVFKSIFSLVMDVRGRVRFFTVLVFLVSVHVHGCGNAEARTLPSGKEERNIRVLESLGMSCRCCDGARGECRSDWESPCAKVECHPFKYL